jgi:hypothetical protein
VSEPSEIREIDPAVVPIVEEFELTMDDWLASVRGDEPLVLAVSLAELLAEARADTE